MNKKKRTQNKLFWLMPVLAVVAFVFLACLNLRTAVWYDEAYSAYLVRGNFAQIWRMTSIDVHPPFYYFCLKVWSLVFGTSDFALRSMSVFFAAIGIILTYFWLKRWFGEKTASIASIALALSPLLMRYSQEMRMYGLVFAIVMSATLVLDIALKSKKKLAWLAYALLICLGMWTHYFTALAWVTHFIYVIYYFRKKGLQKTVFWAYPVAVGLFVPWVPFFLEQSRSIQRGFWIKPVDATTPMGLVTETLIFRNVTETESWLLVLVLATIIVVAVLLAKAWKKVKKNEKESFCALLAFTFVPAILLMLLSMEPFQPTYMTRYVVYGATLMWPVIAVIGCWGWANKKRILCGAVAVLALACATVGITAVDTRNTPGNNEAKVMMQQIVKRGEAPVYIHVDSQHYYDLMFYETDDNPVMAIDVNYEWGSLEPIREYCENYVEDLSLMEWDNERFWIITENGNDYHFDDFELGEKIEDAVFTAQEYRRAAE